MSLLRTNGGQAILTPADVQNLVIQPLIGSAVATRVATTVRTGSSSTRFPIVVADPVNHWVAEGAEIPVSDPELEELVVTPSGLKGLTVVSNELVKDSNPAALQVVGDGLVRDLRAKLDSAFFGDSVTNGPNGIEHLTGVQETTRTFDGSLDVVAEAVSLAEAAGVSVLNVDGLPNLSLVGHPSDVLTLSTAKVAEESNAPLLGVDATQATGRSALGVPIFSTPAAAPGVMWLVPRDRVYIVLRDDPEVIADTSAYFSSARTAIRAILRVGLGFPAESSIVRVIIDGGS